MWSIVVSTGYSSKVIDYSDLESSATARFFNSGLVTVPSYPTSNPDIEPDFTISVPKEFSIVVDIGGRFYPYRTADGKLALFLHFSLLAFYYDWARFHYQLVTGPEVEYVSSRYFHRILLHRFGVGVRYSIRDRLYLEPLFMIEEGGKRNNFYLGIGYRF